jgi:hypothetical protein
MTGKELIERMLKAHRRVHVIGTSENGVIAALDLEGRLFTVINGRVLNRVDPSAIEKRTNRSAYLNPGGDTLWPAPEGTCFGYEYGTGKWRVPPAITGAVWEVVEQAENRSVIRAEVDLVNNRQLGIPCEFERQIEIERRGDGLTQHVTEVIRYIGVQTLGSRQFRLAPWSLCQFDSGAGSIVVMPPLADDDVRDLYDSSVPQRGLSGDLYVVDAQTPYRFQLGLGENVPWIEYRSGTVFRVRRSAGALPAGQRYIDIADAPPGQRPSEQGVKLSVYCDPSGFMEIEACGGCPDSLVPGTELSVRITTDYRSCGAVP